MQQSEAIALIEKAITGKHPQHWADLGCGTGTFTLALASLLPPDSYITAIDKSQQHLPSVASEIRINFRKADFVNEPIAVSSLNGVLMANSLHFVDNKSKLISQLENVFTGSPKFLIIEYDTTRPNPWVPYPISFQRLGQEFGHLGYRINKLAETPSRFGGVMYSALASK